MRVVIGLYTSLMKPIMLCIEQALSELVNAFKQAEPTAAAAATTLANKHPTDKRLEHVE